MFQVIGYSAKELNTLVIEAEQKACGSITVYKWWRKKDVCEAERSSLFLWLTFDHLVAAAAVAR